MINMELNERTAEDAKMVQELKRQGVLEEVIQAAYNNTQAKRVDRPRGDLISRSKLLWMLRYNAAVHTDENSETRQLVAVDIHKLIEFVENMPVAFDVDEVEEQLEEIQESKYPDGRPRFTASERRALEIALTLLNKAKEPKQ